MEELSVQRFGQMILLLGTTVETMTDPTLAPRPALRGVRPNKNLPVVLHCIGRTEIFPRMKMTFGMRNGGRFAFQMRWTAPIQSDDESTCRMLQPSAAKPNKAQSLFEHYHHVYLNLSFQLLIVTIGTTFFLFSSSAVG
jgi:hypothetical protein